MFDKKRHRNYHIKSSTAKLTQQNFYLFYYHKAYSLSTKTIKKWTKSAKKADTTGFHINGVQ